MSNIDRELIAELKVILTNQRYRPVVVGNYCAYAHSSITLRGGILRSRT